MRRACAAALLLGVLAARAQTPPESPPAPPFRSEPAPAQAAPAPARESQAAEAPGLPEENATAPVPAREPPPAPKPAAQRAQPPKPAAQGAPDGGHDAELAALRREVSRLQSELDAERAAAVPAAEEPAAAAAPAAWGWLVTVALVALAAGFVLGWRLLDRRIRHKYGGLRIY